MKSKKTFQFRSSFATTMFCGAVLSHFTVTSASALTLSWDGSDTVTSGAQGGTGTWDSNTTANWWDGSADVVWPNSGTDNDGIFGGTAGTVTVSSVTANEVLFNTSGYILSGASTLTLNGTTPTITTGAGISATIGNGTATVLSGSAGLTKAGLGTLTLNGSAVNNFTGGVTIKGGTLALNFSNLATPTNLIDSTNALTIGGGTLSITGKSTGASVQSFAGTTASSGASIISITRNGGTSATLNLGALTRNAGNTLTLLPATAWTTAASTTEIVTITSASTAGGAVTLPTAGNTGYLGAGVFQATGISTRYAQVRNTSGTYQLVAAPSSTAFVTTAGSASTVYSTSIARTLTGATTNYALISNPGSNITIAQAGFSYTTNGLLTIAAGTTTISGGTLTIGSERDLVINSASTGGVSIGSIIANNGGGASSLTINNTGAGITTLSGANSFTGQTTVNSGKLLISTGGAINTSSGIILNGGTFVQSNTATAITPAITLQGGTVDGTGTINTVNVSDLVTNKITNGNGASTALTIGSLTLSGDATIDIRTAGSAGLVVSGTLTTTPASGTVIVNVTSAPTWTTGNTYNLISYGTLSGAIGDFTKGTITGLGARQTSALVTSGNNIALSITGDSALWTGVASSNWTTSVVGTPFNWKTQAGAADTEFLVSDDVVFDDSAAGSTSINITDATVSPNSTTFNNSTKSYTISGGGIATGTLTKSGSNTVSLTNTNTYTGATTINGGTLRVSGGSAIANTGLVTLGNIVGATFQVVGSETIGALSGGGATGGAVSIDASQTLTLSSGTQTYTGTVSGSGTLTSSGATQTLNGALSHGGGVNVTSAVLTLGSASNSYTGSTVISSGAGLLVTANNALGAIGAGNGTTVTGTGSALISGALGFSGGINYSSAEKIIGSGVGNTSALGVFASAQRGFIQSVSGNNTFAGDIELSANGVSRIGTQDGASLTLTGAITQGAGVTTANILFRVGSTAGDYVTLSNAGNSFGGDSQIFTGLNTGSSYAGVRLGVTNALPTNLTVSGGSATGSRTALDLAGYDQSLNGLNTGLGSLNIINTNTSTPSTLTLNPTANKTSSNTVILGGGGLGVVNVDKIGSFTQTLSGTSTYTGSTAVSQGTLVINGNISTSSLTTVASGATLGGSGTVGALTVNSGGFVTPGTSPGILTVNGNYSQAGEYTAELGGTVAGTGYDQIAVTGSVDITGGSLVTMFSGSYVVNDLLFILTNDLSDSIIGTYSGLAQGAVVINYGGFDWQISYLADSTGNTFTGGNDIALMAIPEPNIAAVLGGFGILALLRRRRA